MKYKSILMVGLAAVFNVGATDIIDIYKEDQAVRAHLRTLPKEEVKPYIKNVMLPGDAHRLTLTESILTQAADLSSDEYFAAAMIMQHGTEDKHYLKAIELAKKAVALDPENKKASWLSCAAEDRYLLKVGKSQIWGTQLGRQLNTEGTYEVYFLKDFDRSARPDKKRVKCGLPALAEMSKRLEAMSKLKDRSAQLRIWKTGK